MIVVAVSISRISGDHNPNSKSVASGVGVRDPFVHTDGLRTNRSELKVVCVTESRCLALLVYSGEPGVDASSDSSMSASHPFRKGNSGT